MTSTYELPSNINDIVSVEDFINAFGRDADLHATHCACCAKRLSDAVSVNRGIGPVCSAEHYDLNFHISDEMVENSLGWLLASGIPSRVKLAMRRFIKSRRDFANVVSWWASIHRDDTKVVIDCSNILSALGFKSLGHVMRTRISDVVITKESNGTYIVGTKANKDFRHYLERTPGVELIKGMRFKYSYRIPANLLSCAKKDFVLGHLHQMARTLENLIKKGTDKGPFFIKR